MQSPPIEQDTTLDGLQDTTLDGLWRGGGGQREERYQGRKFSQPHRNTGMVMKRDYWEKDTKRNATWGEVVYENDGKCYEE